MTTVRIKLSQAVVDREHQLEAQAAAIVQDPDSLFDVFKDLFAELRQDAAATWELAGSSLHINYASGALETYGGVMLNNPTATSGHASASTYAFKLPGAFELSASGQLHMDYQLNGGMLYLTTAAQGLTMNNIRFVTKVPTSSPDYDPDFGNISLTMDGALTVLPTGTASGSISRITVSTDKLIKSSSIEGNFRVAGALDTANYDGTLTSYKTAYQDGSYLELTNASVLLQGAQAVEDTPYRGSSGADDISIDLPGALYRDVVVAAAEGNDLVSIKGGGGRLDVAAGAGDDVVTLQDGGHAVDGGQGLDVVKLSGARAGFKVAAVLAAGSPDPLNPAASVYTVTDSSGAASELTNVERLVFADATLALDIEGNAGLAYRLYQAAFNRTPDAGGLGYWIKALDQGAKLVDVAAGFLAAAEGVKTYGGTLSNVELVTRFYRNILDRDPDAAGRDYWVGLIDQNKATVAQVLAGISESGENKIGLVGVIGNGFVFTPWEQG